MDRIGVAHTVMVLGVTYFVIMLIGRASLATSSRRLEARRLDAAGSNRSAMIATRSVSRNQALRTVQFYLLWGILFINVTAGIGILAQASPMMQDMFSKTPLAAAAVVSLISLFNAGGRFFWASLPTTSAGATPTRCSSSCSSCCSC